MEYAQFENLILGERQSTKYPVFKAEIVRSISEIYNRVNNDKLNEIEVKNIGVAFWSAYETGYNTSNSLAVSHSTRPDISGPSNMGGPWD